MRLLLLAVLLCGQLTAHAAFDVFLEITRSDESTVPGAVTDPLYAGWIRVVGFGHGLTGSSGPPNLAEIGVLSLVKEVDAATPLLFGLVTAGSPGTTVKIVVVRDTPDRVEVWDVFCEGVVFRGNGIAAGEGEPQESLSFSARKTTWSYIQVAPGGAALAEYFASFDRRDPETLTSVIQKGVRAPDYPGAADTDGDGIPNGFETFYGLNPDVKDAQNDPDGDGLRNIHEYLARTDPRRPQSVFRVTAVQAAGSSAVALTWRSVAGRTYRVEGAPAPQGPFTVLKTVPSSGDGTTSTTVPATPGARFYRVATP